MRLSLLKPFFRIRKTSFPLVSLESFFCAGNNHKSCQVAFSPFFEDARSDEAKNFFSPCFLRVGLCKSSHFCSCSSFFRQQFGSLKGWSVRTIVHVRRGISKNLLKSSFDPIHSFYILEISFNELYQSYRTQPDTRGWLERPPF